MNYMFNLARALITTALFTFTTLVLMIWCVQALAAGTVKIGLNYPVSGPYWIIGLSQNSAATIAVEEINAGGGILGNQIELVKRNSKSKTDVTTKNVNDMIDREKVKMIFGGASSAVAVTAGKICQEKGIPFFGTLTYSNTTTGTEARRHVFRECNNAWMSAKVLSDYLKSNFAGKTYFYVTADYSWGHSTEKSIRTFSNTSDKTAHKGVLTPFPGAKVTDFLMALKQAQDAKPDVLVLVLFGKDMEKALKLAAKWRMKETMQIVVPNLTLSMAEGAGPEIMEGVIGSVPWCWQVPYKYDYAQGKAFVEKFAKKFKRYPSSAAASAYTIVYEYKAAVERAGTFDSPAVIRALEGHSYKRLKDTQTWRDFDHQSVQSVYAVKCKAPADVKKDPYKLDYFDIINTISGEEAAHTREEWEAVRIAAGKHIMLERLPGE
ncbi:substrate-binding protein [Desulfococcaceae bacterium HSG9]|nr:substrate-binding protein [Desulfococcaceae bacterium HSG9]